MQRYVVLSRRRRAAIALWVVLTYFDAVVNLLPLLLVSVADEAVQQDRARSEVIGGLAAGHYR